jgi:hypothetical protein
MTKYEAAVVSAYTGMMLGSFSDFHEFVEMILARPVWTHEFASKELSKEIKEKAKPYFVALIVE